MKFSVINDNTVTGASGFSTCVENMGGGGGALQNLMGGSLSQYMRGAWRGGLKMQLENTCEGVYLIIMLQAISLQACKFTKNELLHTHFLRMLARF